MTTQSSTRYAGGIDVEHILGGNWFSAQAKCLKRINAEIGRTHSSHHGKVFQYGGGGATLVCPTVGGGGTGTISVTRAWRNAPWVWFEVTIETYYTRDWPPRYSYHVVCKDAEVNAVAVFVGWLAADHAVTTVADCPVPLDPKCFRSDDERCRIALTQAAMIVPRGRWLSTNGISDIAGFAVHDVKTFTWTPRYCALAREKREAVQ